MTTTDIRLKLYIMHIFERITQHRLNYNISKPNGTLPYRHATVFITSQKDAQCVDVRGNAGEVNFSLELLESEGTILV